MLAWESLRPLLGICCVLLPLMQSKAWAQRTDYRPIDEGTNASGENAREILPTQWESTLGSLRQTIEQLDSLEKSDTPSVRPRASDNSPTGESQPGSDGHLPDLSSQRSSSEVDSDGLGDNPLPQSQQLNDILKRLQLMKSMRQRTPDPVPPNPFPQVAEPAVEPASPTPLPQNVTEVPKAVQAIRDNLDATPNPQSPVFVKATDRNWSGTRVLEQPVDQVALAESLFRVQEYESVSNVVQTMDTSQLKTSERIWLEMLQALSLRRIEDSESAASRFKVLASSASGDYLAGTSEFWLEAMSIKEQTESNIQNIDDTIDMLNSRLQQQEK